MHKKLSLFVATLALAAGVLMQSGTAQAACTWGPISASAHDTTIVSSNVFWGAYAVYGVNVGQWANGGYPLAWFQRYDNGAAWMPNLYGGAYTTQIKTNGTYEEIPTYFNGLQNGTIHNVYPYGTNKIAAIRVQVWHCI